MNIYTVRTPAIHSFIPVVPFVKMTHVAGTVMSDKNMEGKSGCLKGEGSRKNGGVKKMFYGKLLANFWKGAIQKRDSQGNYTNKK